MKSQLHIARFPGGTARRFRLFYDTLERTAFGKYALLYFTALFLIVFWIPSDDFDSQSTYLVRIKLEEFGDLTKIGTLPIEWTFPKFFDYLHAPFLKLGYFECLPGYLSVVLIVVLLAVTLRRQVALTAVLLVFAASPILTAATSAKDDIGIAVFGLLSLFVIYTVRNPALFLPLALLPVCALVGTKFHGVILALPLLVLIGIKGFRDKLYHFRSLPLLLALVPLYLLFSSFDTYRSNVVLYHTPFPIFPYQGGRSTLGYLPLNLYRMVSCSLVDTFDWLWYLMEETTGARLFPTLSSLTLNAKVWNYVVMPNSCFSSFGFFLPVALACSVRGLFKFKRLSFCWSASLLAVFYALGVLAAYVYTSWAARYFLAAYVLSIPALASTIGELRSRWWRRGLMTVALLSSLNVLLWNQERMILPLSGHYGESGIGWQHPSMLPDILDRDKLRFLVWTGYYTCYQLMEQDVKRQDSLTVISTAVPLDVPFLLPFIRNRDGANTRVINNKPEADAFVEDKNRPSQFIWTYKYTVSAPGWKLLYTYPGSHEISLYERVTP